MREGFVFRRCGKCRARVTEKRCTTPGCERASISWAFTVDVAPPGAPRRQRKRQGFDTKSDALAAMAELQGDAANGQVVEPSKMTVGQYLDRWLIAVKSSVRSSTYKSFKGHVDLYLEPALESIPLQALDRATIRTAYGAMQRTSGEAKALSDKTVHNVHVTLHRALADAMNDGLVARNPADRAHKAPRRRAEMATWTAAELRTFLEHVTGERDAALWRTAALTGMRRGELAGLPWRAVDLEAATITISTALVRGTDGFASSEPKTERGRRTIDLDAATVAALRRWKVTQSAERLAAGPAWIDSGCVFTREDGRANDGDVVSQRFERLGKRAKVPRIRFHDLRHTHATILLASGTPAHVVSRRLGHSTESFTLTQYAHVLPGQQRDAADRMAAMVDG
jgi:integrase